MDYRPYILAGTLLLFVVAVVSFFATLVSVRRKRVRDSYETQSRMLSQPTVDREMMDTSLEGLELEVMDDAPSASLLTPLRTGEWMPPDNPAPLDLLEDASLSARGASYELPPAFGTGSGEEREPDEFDTAVLPVIGPDAAPSREAATPCHQATHHAEQYGGSHFALAAAEAAASVAQIAAAASAAQAAAAVSAAQAAAVVSAMQAAAPAGMLPAGMMQPMQAVQMPPYPMPFYPQPMYPVGMPQGYYAPPPQGAHDAVTQPFPAVTADVQPAVAAPTTAQPVHLPQSSHTAPAVPQAPKVFVPEVESAETDREFFLEEDHGGVDDLTAAIAALVSPSDTSAITVIPQGQWEPPVIERRQTPRPVTVPVAHVASPSDAGTQAEAVERPPEPAAVPEPAATSELLLEPETLVQPAATTTFPAESMEPPQPAPAAEKTAPPVVTPPVVEPAGELAGPTWDDMLREQQMLAEPAPRAPRPEVRVAETVVPEPVLSPAADTVPATAPSGVATASARKARPQARVHMRQADETQPELTLAPLQATTIGRSTERSASPEVVMEAPVEMWFGDARVGVKAGTATYEKFRKYADVLFEDLRRSRAE